MTFDAIEESRFGAVPIELYLFTFGIGPDDFYAFTDAERPLAFAERRYEPTPIERDALDAASGRERKDMRITVADTNPVAHLFHIYPPDTPVSLTIRSGHLSDPDGQFNLIYSGRVFNVSYEDSGQAVVTCRTAAVAGRQAGLRRNYQYGCPHVLYGTECKALKGPATITGTPNLVDFDRITFDPGWSAPFEEKKFVTGIVEWDVGSNMASRSIISRFGDTLKLSGPTRGLNTGQPVRLILGCNHTETDCYNIFDNLSNYGGQPWIPLKNPLITNPY